MIARVSKPVPREPLKAKYMADGQFFEGARTGGIYWKFNGQVYLFPGMQECDGEQQVLPFTKGTEITITL